jgi:hypothetical protein
MPGLKCANRRHFPRGTMRLRGLLGPVAACWTLSLPEHETFAQLIYWVCSGGTGTPAVVYEGRTE